MKRALLSVTNKVGLVELAKGLYDCGYSLVSTGGTLAVLLEAGIAAEPIEKLTSFPEMLDGRVKTLHPKVHGGLLYKRDNESHVKTVQEYGIDSIDVLVVNLYDFEGSLAAGKSHAEMIENIDIGGPSMIRSAAKNYKDVLVLSDPMDYQRVLSKIQSGEVTEELRAELAMKAFSKTAYYDSMIARYFESYTSKQSDTYTMGFKRIEPLRYGENPHQGATLYEDRFIKSYLSNYEQLHGKELSYNNVNDLNAAVELCAEFGNQTCAVAVKHATPCAVALGSSTFEAYEKAYNADKVSIFGGIVAINAVIDAKTATLMNEIFLEVVCAADFEPEALDILKSKANIRLLKVDFTAEKAKIDIKYLSGKVLIQDTDCGEDSKFEVVTKQSPTEAQKADMLFGMKVVKYVKSNAVVFVKDCATVAIGGGQTSRIWAIKNAVANNPHQNFEGTVLASDAFFPFEDCVRFAASAGVKAIIQPGGSMNDSESIVACDSLGIAMVCSGIRHFRH